MNDFIHHIMEKHNFVVKVSLREENVLNVDFAGKLPITYRIFQISTDPPLLSNITCEYRGHMECLPINSYLIRLYVLCDIHRTCRKLRLPYNIIRYYKGDELVTNLVDLLPISMTEEDTKTEHLFNNIITDIYANKKFNKFDVKLEEFGLLHSFNLLKGLLV